MTQQSKSKTLVNTKHNKAIRKIAFIFNQKFVERAQTFWQKFLITAIQKSPQFLALKGQQSIKRLNRIYVIKLRQSFNQLVIGTKILQIQAKQKQIEQNKIKDRVYEAKVKSLRVLSRQWKQKKSQNAYKNKYFTPKVQKTPKMIKQKVAQDMFFTLRYLLRQRYLQSFNSIKTSQVIKIRNSKGIYLVNYLLHKKKYWLTYGFQKLKLNNLISRQNKNKQQISQLDTKLVPVQDPQIQSLKQKQQKLQTALDTVNKQKQQIQEEVNTEVEQINKTLQEKRSQIQDLKVTRQKLILNLDQLREKSANYEFSKDQVFYLIYNNFLVNMKLWAEMHNMGLSAQEEDKNIYISKNLILEWLITPALDFNLDKIPYKTQQALKQQIQLLQSLKKQYERLRSQQPLLQIQQILQQFFNNYSINQNGIYFQELFNRNKYSYKILAEIFKENSSVVNYMFGQVEKGFNEIKGQGLEIDVKEE